MIKMDISNLKTKRIITQVITFLSSQEHLSIVLLSFATDCSCLLSLFIPDLTGNSFQLKSSDKPTPLLIQHQNRQLVAMWLRWGSVWQRTGQTVRLS